LLSLYSIRSVSLHFIKKKEKGLKIAINTRLLLKNRLEGIGWFTYESLRRIVKIHPEHQFYFLFDRSFDEEFVFAKNVVPKVVPPQARHPFLFYFWFEQSLPSVLKKIQPDLFVSPDAFNSLKSPFKNLLVIHDLNFEHHPEMVPFLVRKYYRYYSPRFAQKADRIATVSEFSRQDIIRQYGVDASKVDVVYNGANENFRPLTEGEKALVKQFYTAGSDYFIFIGALSQRKNLSNLFRAFDLYKQSSDTNTKLMVVGEKMFHNDDIKSAYSELRHKGDIIFTGRLGPSELYKVLGASLALTYVSVFEGFGIPIIEAFCAGTAVITSNITSMPEIAGDAALTVDPFNPQSIANAMKKITFDHKLKNILIEKGKIRRENFSWDKTAQLLWQSIEKTLKT